MEETTERRATGTARRQERVNVSIPLLTESGDKGQTVTIIVGSSAGGGYDLYGRLIARFLGRHMPGNPAVAVRNMPGVAFLNSRRVTARDVMHATRVVATRVALEKLQEALA